MLSPLLAHCSTCLKTLEKPTVSCGTSLSGPSREPNTSVKPHASQSFINKFWASPSLYEKWIINVTLSNCARIQLFVEGVLKKALQHSLNIHMVELVQVVIWAEKYLWPLHLSVHFAVHLACVVPKPVSLNKDRLFASPAPTLCSAHNTFSRHCQAAQIKSGLNKIYLYLCMQVQTDPHSSALTFLSGRGMPLKDYLSGSGLH